MVIDQRELEGKPVDRVKTFRNKVLNLYLHAEPVINFLYQPLSMKGFDQPFTLGWKPLKRRAHGLKQNKILPGRASNYHGATRACLSLAVANGNSSSLAVTLQDQGVDVLTPERCLTKPFQGKKHVKHHENHVKALEKTKKRYEEVRKRHKQLEEHYNKRLSLVKRLTDLSAGLARPTKEHVEDIKKEKRILAEKKKALEEARKSTRALEQELETLDLQLYRPQSLDLTMGYKYVIRRPGNAGTMTRLFEEKQGFFLQFTGCILAGKTTTLKAFVPATRKVHWAILHGARVVMLRMLPPRGPKKKLVVQIILEGPPAAFAALEHLDLDRYCWSCWYELPDDTSRYNYRFCENCGENLARTNVERLNYPRKTFLGLDINRPSKYMLAFSHGNEQSTESQLSKPTLRVIANRDKTTEEKRELYKARSRAEKIDDHPRIRNIDRQLALQYNKQKNRLKDLHDHRCPVEIGKQLASTDAEVLACEALDIGDAAGKRGALAKAILSMPDEREIPERAITNINTLHALQGTGKRVLLDPVDPRGTSNIHARCPHDPRGHLKRRKGHHDLAPCNKCHQLVNTHVSASQVVEELSTSTHARATTINTPPVS
ncbi:MAG: hypothetical protein ACXAEU_01550 [Candidatus Hodarchaeales archaeon]